MRGHLSLTTSRLSVQPSPKRNQYSLLRSFSVCLKMTDRPSVQVTEARDDLGQKMSCVFFWGRFDFVCATILFSLDSIFSRKDGSNISRKRKTFKDVSINVCALNKSLFPKQVGDERMLVDHFCFHRRSWETLVENTKLASCTFAKNFVGRSFAFEYRFKKVFKWHHFPFALFWWFFENA